MSRETTQSSRIPEVLLNGYPSCGDCLSWSDDGLAVAAGENIHLLVSPSIGSTYARDGNAQSVTTLRVNQFNLAEWHEHTLSTITKMSIGEEQSESVVIALSWSPAGPGLHQRSVLAVLTSNLILSLWETDGSQRGWRRTCIVNEALQSSNSANGEQGSSSINRSRQRIRAFAWSTSLMNATQSRWGLQFLAVVNDDEVLTFLNISKKNRHDYGSWAVSPICEAHLSISIPDSHNYVPTTKLQSQILHGNRIDHLAIGEWTTTGTKLQANVGRQRARAPILLKRFHKDEYENMAIEVETENDETISGVLEIASRSTFDLGSGSLCDLLSGRGPQTTIIHSTQDKPEWRAVLQRLSADYDRRHKLGGLVRIRFWGRAKSPPGNLEAAIVTLHPRDAFEYTSAVTEKSWLIFRTLPGTVLPTLPEQKSRSEVLTRVSRFVVSTIPCLTTLRTEWDKTLLKLLYAWVTCRGDHHDERKSLEQEVLKEMPANTDSADATQARTQTWLSHVATEPETCAICGQSITICVNSSQATCKFGHSFSRCSLTLFSLQQPRVSKQCSGCNRQFLNLSKLGPPDAQSLAFKLFDTFDLCPYCNQKYRG